MRTSSTAVTLGALIVGGVVTSVAQAPAITNSIGMELVLIQPGTLLVGRYTPRCPSPPPSSPPQGAVPATDAGSGRRGGGRGTPLTAEEIMRCEQMAAASRQPGFTVRIVKPFYIGKYEVTQEQWTKVMGKNPSVFQGAKVKDDAGQHPVDSVTWEDASASWRN